MKIETYVVGPLSENYYILTSPNGDITVIDPGYDCESTRKAFFGREDKIKTVLLTHAHADHIMGLAYILEHANPKIYYHKLEDGRLRDSKLSLYYRMRAFFKKSDGENGGELFEKDLDNFAFVEDGDEIDLGEFSLKVLHTPGHTSGSVCYLGDGFIFSGDTLFKNTVGRCDLESGDENQMAESIKRLKKIEGNLRVYPGHAEPTTLDEERANNPYMQKV
jgi:hydroxyacylglutathione hydrolase